MASRTSTKLVCLAAIIVILAVATSGPVAEALTCGDVEKSLGPCVQYLKKGGNTVPGDCCSGIKSLVSAAKTTADKQTACKCLKSASGGINVGAAAALPGKCGVSIPYKISPSTDCNTELDGYK